MDSGRELFDFKPSRSQRPRLDRFVMPRDCLDDLQFRLRRRLDDKIVNIWPVNHQQQRRYRSHLNAALGLEPKCQVLNTEYVQPWPCAPRKRPCLRATDNILDLPAYSNSIYLLDWSSKNILVAALQKKYHTFSWSHQSSGQLYGITRTVIYCCKVDPKGLWLLIGTDMRTAEIHDYIWGKCINYVKCQYVHHTQSFCAITAVDWSPTGNMFVLGCSRGTVSAFEYTSTFMGNFHLSDPRPIVRVKISPDSRYVAVLSLFATWVHLLSWPSLTYFSLFKVSELVKSIAWHPWRSALLGVGMVTQDFGTVVTVWDTPTQTDRNTNLKVDNLLLDVMLFSDKTGELVLSMFNPASEPPNTQSQLMVMSDPWTVVDQSGDNRTPIDRVRTMVFSPDGTMLATATADEDLIVWNFVPSDKKKSKKRVFSAIPAYLDVLKYGCPQR